MTVLLSCSRKRLALQYVINQDAERGLEICSDLLAVSFVFRYMKAAKLGETITMDATTLKKGSKLSFSTVDFRNSAGQLIAQGKHTKFLDLNSPGTRS